MILSVAVALIITLGLWFIIEVLLKAENEASEEPPKHGRRKPRGRKR